MKEIDIQLTNFKNAISRLKEALEYDYKKIDIALDAVIKRFEFTFEMSWKSIMLVAKNVGKEEECKSPKTCLKLAYKMGWIKNEGAWLSLLEARNLTSHIYSQTTAEDVYETVRESLELFNNLLEALKKENE